MTSRDFVCLTGRFIQDSPALEYLLSLLGMIKEAHTSLLERMSAVIRAQNGSSQLHSAQTSLTTALSSFSSTIRTDFDTQKVWAGVEDLRGRAAKLREETFAQEVAGSIGGQLSIFSNAYEQFVKTYSADNTFALIAAGNDLYLAVDSLRVVAVLAQQALTPVTTAGEGESELELSFSSVPTLADFAAKLTALAELYQKLCELGKVSTATSPLRIIKIETGTWNLKVFGPIAIIATLGALIENAALFLYRNYTVEGKISMIPRRAEAVEEVLKLKKSLADANINTSGMDAHLQGASVALAQNLNTLLGGESRIVINNSEIGTGHAGGRTPRELVGGGRDLLMGGLGDEYPPPSSPAEN